MTITDQEFVLFQRFIHDAAGIALSTSKKALVSSRLAKRLSLLKLRSGAAIVINNTVVPDASIAPTPSNG